MKNVILILFVLASGCSSAQNVGDTLPTVTYDVNTGQVFKIDSGFTENTFKALNDALLTFQTEQTASGFQLSERVGIQRATPVTFEQSVVKPTTEILQATAYDDRGTIYAARVFVFENTGLALEIGSKLVTNSSAALTSATITGIPPEMVKVVTMMNAGPGIFISIRRLSSTHAVAALVASTKKAKTFLKNANLGAEDEFGHPVENFYIH